MDWQEEDWAQCGDETSPGEATHAKIVEQTEEYIKVVCGGDISWIKPTVSTTDGCFLVAHRDVRYAEDVWRWLQICVCLNFRALCHYILEGYQAHCQEHTVRYSFPSGGKVSMLLSNTLTMDDINGSVDSPGSQTSSSADDDNDGTARRKLGVALDGLVFPAPLLTRRAKHKRWITADDLPEMETLLSWRCERTGFTLLHCAAAAGHVSVMQLLLEWKAPVSPTALRSRTRRGLENADVWFSPCRDVTPLWLAAALHRHEVVACLLAAGASLNENALWPNHALGRVISPWLASVSDAETCRALHAGGAHPAPIMVYWTALKYGLRDTARFLACPGVTRWDRACCRELDLCRDLAFEPRCRQVLEIPRSTPHEHICKVMFCQTALHHVCLCHGQAPVDMETMAAALTALLRHGASATGWSRLKAEDLCRAWNRIPDDNSCWLDGSRRDAIGGCQMPVGCHGPPNTICNSSVADITCHQLFSTRMVTRADPHDPVLFCPDHDPKWFFVREERSFSPLVARLTRDVNRQAAVCSDPLARVLIQNGALPGVVSLAAVPFANGRLHDGPTCCHPSVIQPLPSAQCTVHFMRVLQPNIVPSLREQCCARILAELGDNSSRTRHKPELVHFRWLYSIGQEKLNRREPRQYSNQGLLLSGDDSEIDIVPRRC